MTNETTASIAASHPDLQADLFRIATELAEICRHLRNNPSLSTYDSAAILAMCEKAGFLADRCIARTGSIGVYGSLESWCHLDLAEETA